MAFKNSMKIMGENVKKKIMN